MNRSTQVEACQVEACRVDARRVEASRIELWALSAMGAAFAFVLAVVLR